MTNRVKYLQRNETKDRGTKMGCFEPPKYVQDALGCKFERMTVSSWLYKDVWRSMLHQQWQFKDDK